ncbi:MAG: hypothetical protein IJM30_08870 [Thermoguttaceae bacterium]|nr:hypothetical protein [Thermoguttaceae bacterium]
MKSRKIVALASLSALCVAGLVCFALLGRGPLADKARSILGPRETAARRDLRRFDEKLAPVAERREKLREAAREFADREARARAEFASALAGLDASTRARVLDELRAGKLSDAGETDPNAVLVRAKYREARDLARHSSVVRQDLAKIEVELTRAVTERDRLERRAELIDALGRDPDDETSDSGALEALDELVAAADESIAERESREAKPSVADVAGASEPNDDQFLNDLVQGKTPPVALEDGGYLDERLARSATARNERRQAPILLGLTAFGPRSVAGAVAFALVAVLIGTSLARGNRARAANYGSGNYGPGNYGPGTVIPVPPPGARREPEPPRRSGNNVLLGLALVLIGFWVGGPIGAILGLLFAICASSARPLIAALGVAAGLFVLIPIAIILFVLAVIAIVVGAIF